MTVESRIEPAQRRYSSFVLLPVSFLFLVATALRLDLKIRIGGHRDEGILNTSAKGS